MSSANPIVATVFETPLITGYIVDAVETVLNYLVGGIVSWVMSLFVGMTENLLIIDPGLLGYVAPINNIVMLGVFTGLATVFLINHGITWIMFPDSDKTHIKRALLRLVGAALILASDDILFEYAIIVTNEIIGVINPGQIALNFSFGQNGIEALKGGGGVFALILAAGWFLVTIVSSLALFWLTLAMRVLIILVFFALFPLFVALLISDVGGGKYFEKIVNIALSLFVMMLLVGPIVMGVLSVSDAITNSQGVSSVGTNNYQGWAGPNNTPMGSINWSNVNSNSSNSNVSWSNITGNISNPYRNGSNVSGNRSNWPNTLINTSNLSNARVNRTTYRSWSDFTANRSGVPPVLNNSSQMNQSAGGGVSSRGKTVASGGSTAGSGSGSSSSGGPQGKADMSALFRVFTLAGGLILCSTIVSFAGLGAMSGGPARAMRKGASGAAKGLKGKMNEKLGGGSSGSGKTGSKSAMGDGQSSGSYHTSGSTSGDSSAPENTSPGTSSTDTDGDSSNNGSSGNSSSDTTIGSVGTFSPGSKSRGSSSGTSDVSSSDTETGAESGSESESEPESQTDSKSENSTQSNEEPVSSDSDSSDEADDGQASSEYTTAGRVSQAKSYDSSSAGESTPGSTDLDSRTNLGQFSNKRVGRKTSESDPAEATDMGQNDIAGADTQPSTGEKTEIVTTDQELSPDNQTGAEDSEKSGKPATADAEAGEIDTESSREDQIEPDQTKTGQTETEGETQAENESAGAKRRHVGDFQGQQSGDDNDEGRNLLGRAMKAGKTAAIPAKHYADIALEPDPGKSMQVTGRKVGSGANRVHKKGKQAATNGRKWVKNVRGDGSTAEEGGDSEATAVPPNDTDAWGPENPPQDSESGDEEEADDYSNDAHDKERGSQSSDRTSSEPSTDSGGSEETETEDEVTFEDVFDSLGSENPSGNTETSSDGDASDSDLAGNTNASSNDDADDSDSAGNTDASSNTDAGDSDSKETQSSNVSADHVMLGVDPGASEDEIKAAYRRKAMEVHPDKGGSRAKFKELNEAKDRLINH